MQRFFRDCQQQSAQGRVMEDEKDKVDEGMGSRAGAKAEDHVNTPPLPRNRFNLIYL